MSSSMMVMVALTGRNVPAVVAVSVGTCRLLNDSVRVSGNSGVVSSVMGTLKVRVSPVVVPVKDRIWLVMAV